MARPVINGEFRAIPSYKPAEAIGGFKLAEAKHEKL
jgi:hypothetical protein